VSNLIASPKAIIGIDAGTQTVKKNIALNNKLHDFGLNIK